MLSRLLLVAVPVSCLTTHQKVTMTTVHPHAAAVRDYISAHADMFGWDLDVPVALPDDVTHATFLSRDRRWSFTVARAEF